MSKYMIKKIKRAMTKCEKQYDKMDGKPLRQARIVKKMQSLEKKYLKMIG